MNRNRRAEGYPRGYGQRSRHGGCRALHPASDDWQPLHFILLLHGVSSLQLQMHLARFCLPLPGF